MSQIPPLVHHKIRYRIAMGNYKAKREDLIAIHKANLARIVKFCRLDVKNYPFAQDFNLLSCADLQHHLELQMLDLAALVAQFRALSAYDVALQTVLIRLLAGGDILHIGRMIETVREMALEDTEFQTNLWGELMGTWPWVEPFMEDVRREKQIDARKREILGRLGISIEGSLRGLNLRASTGQSPSDNADVSSSDRHGLDQPGGLSAGPSWIGGVDL